MRKPPLVVLDQQESRLKIYVGLCSLQRRHQAHDLQNWLKENEWSSLDRDFLQCQSSEDGKTATLSLYYDRQTEQFIVQEVSCYSSMGLGLGTCGCHSHDPYEEDAITDDEARAWIESWLERPIDEG